MAAGVRITSTARLDAEFRRMLRCGHRYLRLEGGGRRSPEVLLRLDGREFRFAATLSLQPTHALLEELAAARRSGALPPLIVAPSLTGAFADACRTHSVSAIDLNGRMFLRARGLLVDRDPDTVRRYRSGVGPQSLGAGKSARILRTLLSNVDRSWSPGELARRGGVSPALVTRITQHLEELALLERIGPRELRVLRPLDLLDLWAEEDRLPRRAETCRYAALAWDPESCARELLKSAQRPRSRIAFTQWTGAWLRRPEVQPPVLSAYVEKLPPPPLLDRLGLREADGTGTVWLHLPADEGVFLETQSIGGMPVVSDAQLYLDLHRAELRGADAAAALRDWDGFLKP